MGCCVRLFSLTPLLAEQLIPPVAPPVTYKKLATFATTLVCMSCQSLLLVSVAGA
jgi:hypothetical protein